MKQETIIIGISIFILIVAGMFGFAYLKKSEINTQIPAATSQDQQSASSSSVPYSSITTITAKHYFIDGVHTFAGEIPMPTLCDLIDATSTVPDAKMPKSVSLNFTVINNAQTCEQVVTNVRFKVSYQGDADTQFSALLMGRNVKLNLIPAGPGEKPEDFQLYQKG